MLEVLVTTTALLCAVLLIRGILGKKLSAGARYALWGLVLLRLLVPVTFFQSPVSVMNAMPPAGAVRVEAEAATVYAPSAPFGGTSPTSGGGYGAVDPVSPKPPPLVGEVAPPQAATEGASPAPTLAPKAAPSLPEILFGVWLAGALAVGGWFFWVNLTFTLRLRRARRPVQGVLCPIPVYRADFLPSPCLAGVLHPAVYLNESALRDQVALGHVLTHELCHKRHGDNLWALLRGLSLALWWFHPLVWVSAVLSKRDCELFCDEAAVRLLGEDHRIPYGRTLVRMVAAKRPGPGDLLCASTAMTEGKKQIKERVIQVVHRKKMPKAALAACVALALLAGLCTFTGAVEQSVPTPMPNQVQADPAFKVSALDPKSVTVPDFGWVGSQDEFCREVGLKWAAAYGRQFYALPDGNSWKAVDVQVIEPVFHDPLYTLTNDTGETTMVYGGGDRHAYDRNAVNGASGYVNLAVKPVGGIDAVRDLFQGGVPRGTGALSDYVMLEYGFDLKRVDGQWVTESFYPGWNKNPPPEYNDWTDGDLETWSKGLRVDIGPTVAGDDKAAWEQAGRAWAELFTGQHYKLYDQGNPAKADDVQVLSMELQTWEPNEKPDTLFFHLKYAFRPVWGVQSARLFMGRQFGSVGGGNSGEGVWEDYLIVDAAVTLVRDGTFQGEGTLWRGFELKTEYAQNYENGMKLTREFTVPQGQGAQVSEVEPVGVAVSYPADADETAMGDLVFGKWATAFAQQFYQLPAGDPLACSKVVTQYYDRFSPTVVTASGMTRVSNAVTGSVSLVLTPKNGAAGAEAALKDQAEVYLFQGKDAGGRLAASWDVTLVRGTGADGSTSWTCTAAAPDVYEPGTEPGSGTFPIHVEPRAGWTIPCLDYDAVYVPDDGKGDLEHRWLAAFGQEFYALPEGNPWKASDVQVRWAGDNLCLAVKPLGGTAALEPNFPFGCSKGSGDLDGYLLLQYTLTLRKETIAQFGTDPVWVAMTGYVGPIWAAEPPAVGSEDWQNDMEYTWTKFKEGKYASAYGGNGDLDACTAAGRAWVWDYLGDFLEFGLGGASMTPILSDDVQLSYARYNPKNGNQTMEVEFQFYFRPLWGTDVVRAFYGGDIELGTGQWAGYVVRTQTATLEFRPAEEDGWSDHWVCVEMK